MKSLILILSLISFCCAGKLGTVSDSSTADFTVLSKNDNYEYRRYGNLTWIWTDANTIVYDESNFVDIFNYMNGENSKGIKVKQGTPTITAVSKHQTNLPLPLSDKVLVHQYKNFDVYVRSFEGNPDQEEFMRQANILIGDLIEDGITETDVYLNYFYMIKYENSNNEVFIVIK